MNNASYYSGIAEADYDNLAELLLLGAKIIGLNKDEAEATILSGYQSGRSALLADRTIKVENLSATERREHLDSILGDAEIAQRVFDEQGIIYDRASQSFYVIDEETCSWKLAEADEEKVRCRKTMKQLKQQLLNDGFTTTEVKPLDMTRNVNNAAEAIKMLDTNFTFNKIKEEIIVGTKAYGGPKVLNLRTGELRQATKEDYITFAIPTPYIPLNTTNKREREFLAAGKYYFDMIMQSLPDEETRNFVIDIFAHGLTGYVGRSMYVFKGGGANGKTLLTSLFARFARGFAKNPDASLITGSNQRFGYSTFAGARTVIFEELGKGNLLKEDVFKRMIATTTILVEEKFKTGYERENVSTVILNTNHMPTLSSNDEGTKRRFEIIEFPYKFVLGEPTNEREKRANPSINAGFIDTLAQKPDNNLFIYMLSLLVDHAQKLFPKDEEGDLLAYAEPIINVPASTTALKEKWLAGEDMLTQFIETHLTVPKPRGGTEDKIAIRTVDLYEAYREFMEAHGRRPLNSTNFVKDFEETDFFKENGLQPNRRIMADRYALSYFSHDQEERAQRTWSVRTPCYTGIRFA